MKTFRNSNYIFVSWAVLHQPQFPLWSTRRNPHLNTRTSSLQRLTSGFHFHICGHLNNVHAKNQYKVSLILICSKLFVLLLFHCHSVWKFALFLDLLLFALYWICLPCWVFFIVYDHLLCSLDLFGLYDCSIDLPSALLFFFILLLSLRT